MKPAGATDLIARSALRLAGEQEPDLPLAHVSRLELHRDALAQWQVALAVRGHRGVGQLDAPAAGADVFEMGG